MFVLLTNGKLIDTDRALVSYRIKGSVLEVVDMPQVGWSEPIGNIDCVGETREEIEWKRNRYEGWTAEDFKVHLELYFNPARFKSKAEVKEWTADNQPYYKKPITILVNYFWNKVLEYQNSKVKSVFYDNYF